MTSLKKIFRFLKPYTAMVIFAVILMVVEVASNVLQPKYMEQIVDDGVLRMNIDVVVHAGVMMLLVAVVGGIGGFVSCVLSNIYSQKFGSDLRKTAFRKIMALSPEQSDVFTPGALITRMTSDTRVVTEFSAILIQMLVKPLMLFIMGIVMVLTIDAVYGLILLITLPIQVVLLYFFIKHSSAIFKIIQKKTDKLNASALHLVADNRLIKSYVKEDYESASFDKQSIDLAQTVMKVQLFMAVLNPVVMLLLNAVVLAVIFIGGFQVQAQLIQVGSIMAAISYSQQIMMSMMTMGGIFQYVSRSKVSAERLQQVMELEPSVKSGSVKLDEPFESLELNSITFRYPRCKDAPKPALDDLNITISKGETVGILGATGAGKSTVAHMMIRSYDPDCGTVLLNSRDIREYDLKSLHDHLIPVFQKSDMLAGSLRDNITKGCKCSEDDFDRAVNAAMVDEFADKLPDGYDTVISERGASLSGGQKQRVAIARALIREPSVLIFDDSTSNLDLDTERKVMDNITKQYKHLTSVLISQRIAGVMHADRIILLDCGHVAAQGSHEELMKTSPLYKSIYDTQFAEGGDANE